MGAAGLYYGFRWSGGVMTQVPALRANTYNGVNAIEAQTGKGLTESQATLILETLAQIRADLGCA